MERLTEQYWRNLDPWECCGQDNFCQRGCHNLGGCTNGCIVPKLYVRLAVYEDFMERCKLTSIEELDRIFYRVNTLGGTDLMAQYRGIGSIDHLRELLQAENDGRMMVLPCRVGTHLWRVTHPYRNDAKVTEFIMKNFRTIGKKHILQIEVQAINSTVKKWMCYNDFFVTREEAEAELKKIKKDV